MKRPSAAAAVARCKTRPLSHGGAHPSRPCKRRQHPARTVCWLRRRRRQCVHSSTQHQLRLAARQRKTPPSISTHALLLSPGDGDVFTQRVLAGDPNGAMAVLGGAAARRRKLSAPLSAALSRSRSPSGGAAPPCRRAPCARLRAVSADAQAATDFSALLSVHKNTALGAALYLQLWSQNAARPEPAISAALTRISMAGAGRLLVAKPTLLHATPRPAAACERDVSTIRKHFSSSHSK
jgi:hypothetical protein